jgi:hypothetical protein
MSNVLSEFFNILHLNQPKSSLKILNLIDQKLKGYHLIHMLQMLALSQSVNSTLEMFIIYRNKIGT